MYINKTEILQLFVMYFLINSPGENLIKNAWLSLS